MSLNVALLLLLLSVVYTMACDASMLVTSERIGDDNLSDSDHPDALGDAVGQPSEGDPIPKSAADADQPISDGLSTKADKLSKPQAALTSAFSQPSSSEVINISLDPLSIETSLAQVLKRPVMI